MIRLAISDYYEKLKEVWNKNRDSLPKVPYNEKMPKEIYIGDKSESNYISWQLIENKKTIDFNIISKELGFELHNDIKEYLSSYFFLKMTGQIENIIVSMTPITPLTDIRIFLTKRNKLALEVGRDNKIIEIGLVEIDGADNLLLCVDNSTGEVKWLDIESTDSGLIAPSLDKLIYNMEPRC